jgi:hypothetical protein
MSDFLLSQKDVSLASLTARWNGASGESKGLRRYDKENLLWQSIVAIRSCWLSIIMVVVAAFAGMILAMMVI